MSDFGEKFERLLGRSLTDKEKQELLRVKEVLGIADNDALWDFARMLYFYNDKYLAMVEEIKEAGDIHQEALKAGAELAATNANQKINESVLALLPNIRADISADVSRSASTAFKQVALGRGMFSLWSGGLVAAGLILLGILIDSGVYRQILLHPHPSPKDIQGFQANYSWAIAIGLSAPVTMGLGCWMIERDYSSESKFAGWLIIGVSIFGFLIPGLKIMGWWWK